MDPIALGLILLSDVILALVAFIFFKRLTNSTRKNSFDAAQRERELKRRVFELQVLRTLEERVGYSLNLIQILEVITDSLKGLVDFAAVSYMTLGREGKIVLKVRLEQSVSRLFLNQAKEQMIQAFSAMAKKELPADLVEETISGNLLDDRSILPVGSFFNLPIVIGREAVAMVSVFSPKLNLYGDEETAILYTILGQVSLQASKLSQVVENEKRKMSAMIASLADGILMVDPQFNLVVANQAAADLLAVKGQLTLHQAAEAVAHQTDLHKNIQDAMHGQTIVKIAEFECGGHAISIDIEPVKDHLGYLLGVAVVLHDTSEHRHLEDMRESFIGLMIHQLRTPLTTISYSTNMILTDMPKISLQQVEQNVQIINSTAAGMLTLVNDLLDVTRIESGKLMVIKQLGNLGQLVRERVNAVRDQAAAKQLQLESEIDPDLARVEFDKVRLTQALDHVIGNAIRFTQTGTVSISAKLFGKNVVITVKDSGEGIKADNLPKLFSKFEQFSERKWGEGKGTGLGLLITKGIIEAHGGTIKVESAGENQGTTVTMSIPLE